MSNRPLLSILLLLLLLVILSWIFTEILVYLIIATILVAILQTPTNYLSQTHIGAIKMPRLLAIIASFSILAGILSFFVFLFAPLISDQIKILSEVNYDLALEKIKSPLSRIEKFLLTKKLVNASSGFLFEQLRQSVLNLFANQGVANFINNLVSLTGTFLVGLLAVVFISFFLLYENGIIRRGIIAAIPNKYFEFTINAMCKLETLLSNYLLGLLTQMLLIFSLLSISLLIAGVNYAVTIAVFAAIIHLIPYVGPTLASCTGLLVGVSTSPEFAASGDYTLIIAKILFAFGTVYLIDNVIFQPVIFSKSVKAHPLEIFIIIFAGASLAGPLGMVAAIPAWTIMKVSVYEFILAYRQYRVFRASA